MENASLNTALPDPRRPTHPEEPVTAAHLLALPLTLHPCPSRQCLRLVASQGTYCCTDCRVAWEAAPRYEPHQHSPGCDHRQADRRWPVA